MQEIPLHGAAVKNGGLTSMKSKNLLFLLPALLVLSSCQAVPQANNLKEDILIEDTLAHDEIFGNDFIGRKIAPNKLGDDPVSHPDSDAAIGVQTKVDDKGTVSTADDLISFRFVAPVKFEEGQLAPTTAVWTRTVSKPDGSEYPMDTATYECTEAYTQLEEGAGVYTIAQFNEAQEPDTDYTHFVVYTLRNIPLETYGDYFVSAYLTLSGEGGVNQVSKAVVSTVNPATYQAAYVAADGHYYLDGTFNGTPGIIPATSVRADGNKANFNNLDLVAGDTFVIKEFYNSKLYVHSFAEMATYDGNDKIASCFEADGSGNVKVKESKGGSYDLYFNSSNRLYTAENAPYGVHNGYYIKGSMNSWAQDAAYEMYSVRDNHAVSGTIHLDANAEFKVWKAEGDVWYGWPGKAVSTDSSLFENAGGNIKCLVAGDYRIYLNNSNEVWVNPVE